jgi:hypothetical protein
MSGHCGAACPGDGRSTLTEVNAHRLIAASQMIRRSQPGSPMPCGWNACPVSGAYTDHPNLVPGWSASWPRCRAQARGRRQRRPADPCSACQSSAGANPGRSKPRTARSLLSRPAAGSAFLGSCLCTTSRGGYSAAAIVILPAWFPRRVVGIEAMDGRRAAPEPRDRRHAVIRRAGYPMRTTLHEWSGVPWLGQLLVR